MLLLRTTGLSSISKVPAREWQKTIRPPRPLVSMRRLMETSQSSRRRRLAAAKWLKKTILSISRASWLPEKASMWGTKPWSIKRTKWIWSMNRKTSKYNKSRLGRLKRTSTSCNRSIRIPEKRPTTIPKNNWRAHKREETTLWGTLKWARAMIRPLERRKSRNQSPGKI